MSDDFPRWPPDWLDEYDLSKEETLAAAGDVELRTGLRGDGQVLFSVQWPEGLRWMLVDPVGGGVPHALRIGERSEEPETSRLVEGLWSQALTFAKQLIDGDITSVQAPRRRRFGRG